MSVMVIRVVGDADSYAADTSVRAEAAVKVKPLRGFGVSSIIAESLDWNTPMRELVIDALNLQKKRIVHTQNP